MLLCLDDGVVGDCKQEDKAASKNTSITRAERELRAFLGPDLVNMCGTN